MLRPHAAGIGAEEIYVAVPSDYSEEPVRCFSTFTCDLHAFAEWLEHCGITTVAMESTGVYWIPIFKILESRGFEVFLVNAHYLKSAPAEKATFQIASGFSISTPLGSFKAASAHQTRYVQCERCGGIVKACFKWPPNTFCTCRNRSV